QVRCENDANCFVLSEAYDGAAAGSASAFGVIIGTGCGGGFIINANLLNGPRNIGGEWGHNPLPWPKREELSTRTCWCGRQDCIETWVSGPALAHDHQIETGESCTAEIIVEQAKSGNDAAQATLKRHQNRLGRSLAHIINILDPHVIVLGGGLSAMDHLYDNLENEIQPYIFSAQRTVDIRRPKWGDASGVRGAARLWQLA
ncbi:MAG: ROK family protein, partial [Pseudomonadota bacterium]